jgi:hypothetical protein
LTTSVIAARLHRSGRREPASDISAKPRHHEAGEAVEDERTGDGDGQPRAPAHHGDLDHVVDHGPDVLANASMPLPAMVATRRRRPAD